MTHSGDSALVSRAGERVHRRLLLCGIGALLVMSLSPVLGHHLTASLDAALMGNDHFMDVCLIAVHTLLAPVHGTFHVLLLIGLLYASYDRVSAVLHVRRTLALLPVRNDHSAALAAAVGDAGVPAKTVRVIDRLPIPAFTAGWWNPHIFVSSELESALPHDQLVAVLAHEAQHVRNRDPLKLSLLRFVASTLFWIPAFRRLAADVADESEIAADDAAAGAQPLVLAAAILSLARWATSSTERNFRFPPGSVSTLVEAASAGKVRDALLERRVRRLAGEHVTASSHLTRRSIIVAGAMLCAVWLSGVAVAHPMPTGGLHATHCEHPGEGTLSHLFCQQGLFSTQHRQHEESSLCPHALPRA